MDGLSALLDGPRARGAFLLRCLMAAPWAIRIEDAVPLSLTGVVRGQAWARIDDDERLPAGGRAGTSEPLPVEPGDVVIAVGGRPWTLADRASTPVTAIIRPGQACFAPDGRSLTDEYTLGVRSWGNSRAGETTLLTGSYLVDGEVTTRLLRVLPPLIVVREKELGSPLLALLADEIVRCDPGQDAVLDRLLDLLLIAALRAWFSRPDAAAPRWYLAQADPVVGPALRLLQGSPEQPWTIADLANAAAVSRAAFARRFTDLVGEPPMAFLTAWRLALAADLLLDPDLTLAAIARRVGYATPFALSTAFKRHYGVSPSEDRARPVDQPATAGGQRRAQMASAARSAPSVLA